MESPTTAGCMCKMGFLSGKTACFVGNVAVRKHRTRQLGKLGVGGCDDAAGGSMSEGGGEVVDRTVLDIIARGT